MYQPPYGNRFYWAAQQPQPRYWTPHPQPLSSEQLQTFQMNFQAAHAIAPQGSPYSPEATPTQQCYVRPVQPYWTPQPQPSSYLSPQHYYTPPQVMVEVPREEVYHDEELVHIPPNPKNFWIIKKLGEGIFGTVFLAIEKINEFRRRFAVKRIKNWEYLPEKELQDCKREIALLQSINHPNVIKCFTHYREKKDLLIVLEFADASDLKNCIAAHAQDMLLLEEPLIWDYFGQISVGLQALHQQGILHRDLKPENIFLTTRGVVKIGDLGLSRTLSHTKKDLTIKVGTPYYMAPEKINSPSYDYKSDVWGLGCLLYEMALQRSPFYGECTNSFALIKRIEKSDYPPIPSDMYTEQLSIAIYYCLRPDPKKRPGLNDLIKAAQYMLELFRDAPVEEIEDGWQPYGEETLIDEDGY